MYLGIAGSVKANASDQNSIEQGLGEKEKEKGTPCFSINIED